MGSSTKAFPLGKVAGAAGMDEGATGYPTEQKKTGVQAAGRWALVFYKERLRVIAPSSVCFADSFPQGEAAGRGRSTALIPFVRNDSPSPPSWGAGRYGRWIMGRRPGRKKRGPLQGPPKLEKVGPGRKNLFLPGVLPPAFFQRKPGPPRAGRATGPLRPEAPEKPPTTQRVRSTCRTPPGPGGNPSQVLTCAGPRPDHLPTGPPAPPGDPRSRKGPGHWPGPFIPLLRGGLN